MPEHKVSYQVSARASGAAGRSGAAEVDAIATVTASGTKRED